MSKSTQNYALVDIFTIARDRQKIQTQVKLGDMPELKAFLSDPDDSDTLSVEIEGIEGDKGLPGARLKIQGMLHMNCVRCTKPVEVPIDRDVPFLFVKSEEEANRLPIEDEDWEVVVGSDRMNVAHWVQEEVILSLPNFPQHDDCEAPHVQSNPEFEQEMTEKPKPFANLRDLMQKNN